MITVDSFEGGALPLKAQIRSIRISRDQFAAENHSAGGVSVEIITQPGIGPIRVHSGVALRDGSMSARSPFTPRKGPEQLRTYNFGLGGTLISQKSSFNLFVLRPELVRHAQHQHCRAAAATDPRRCACGRHARTST